MENIKVISQSILRQERINQRIEVLKAQPASSRRDAMISELQNGNIPHLRFKEGFKQEEYIKPVYSGSKVAEFATTGDFPSQWKTRQEYEFNAGRDEVVEQFHAIYKVVVDPSLPPILELNSLESNGFVFTDVPEGGEMTFTSVSSTQAIIRMGRVAVGLEYTEELFRFNQFWKISNLDRAVGTGHSAKMNDIHFSPILTYTYAGGDVIDGPNLTTFSVADPLELKYARTLEAAINVARMPGASQRPGPYVLLTGSSDQFVISRALYPVGQFGFSQQTPLLPAQFQSMIVYDGWTGMLNKLPVTYAGVPAGVSFLVDLSQRNRDFQSYWTWILRERSGDGDLSRNIMAQTFFDSYGGVYANPAAAVIKIEWPTAASGV